MAKRPVRAADDQPGTPAGGSVEGGQSGSSKKRQARLKVKARVAVSALANADYELGCAGNLLEQGGAVEWQSEADDLMRRCIDLRTRIAAAVDA